MFKRALLAVVCVTAAACGSSTPAAPTSSSSSSALSAPTSFVITLQQVFLDRNTVAMSWSGGSSTYRVFVGSTAGASDLLSADVTGTTYTWAAPKTAGIFYVRVAGTSGGQTGTASTELPVFTIDLRNVIDALYYNAGPMSQTPSVAPSPNQPALVWADGTQLTVLVTTESTAAGLTAAQQFVSDYLAAAGNPFSATVSATNNDYHTAVLEDLPLNTIVVRVAQVCTSIGVIACANLGPAPLGFNKSFINMNTSGGAVSIAHEIGHGFGLWHFVMGASGREEFKFLMNPALVTFQLSTVEKTAIAAARAGGIRQGTTRNQAQGFNLVLPFTGATISGMPSILLDDIIRSPVIR